MSQVDNFEKIRTTIFWRRSIILPHGQCVAVAVLLREEDWRPLDAPWWRGKQAYIIGVEEHGNFFLRHCDGSVRYWDHSTQADTIVAPSVRAFAELIVEADSTGA
jgi:hypothetical protein